jgi:hypothetical protein
MGNYSFAVKGVLDQTYLAKEILIVMVSNLSYGKLGNSDASKTKQ